MSTQTMRVYIPKQIICEKQSKFYPITCHEGPDGEYRHSSTLSLNSVLDGGVWSATGPVRFITDGFLGCVCKIAKSDR